VINAGQDDSTLIAVVGMSARFPGAPSIDDFWQLLVTRGDAIRPVPADRWDAAARLDPEKEIQAVGGFLDNVDEFDAAFFGVSPREAEALDPQQRLMLEASWLVLEDADTPASVVRGSRTGVYVGTSWHDYEILRKDRSALPTQHSAVGNAPDVIAARISYFYGFTGPSLTVETGCSSSLVALHLAAQALRAGEIEGAIVGGVNLILTPDVSIQLTHFGGLSPTGRCQAFAATADGFVRGEGVAAVYLKTLDRALRDGDRIRGVIVGTAVNNDGGGESLVTPSPDGQEDLLHSVYGDGAVSPADVVYVEAHGTGTGRGDPIEAGALGRVLGGPRREHGPLAVGSVKTNIGHLEAAAGMAGLVKVLLALRHRIVPPNLHGSELNPAIAFDDLNIQVVREPVEIPGSVPVIMGVNSFGWGGTNAHVAVMSPPAALPAADVENSQAPLVVPVSAHSEDALRARAADLADVLEAGLELPAVAGTLAWRRDHLAVRAAVAATEPAETVAALRALAADPSAETPGLLTGRAIEHRRTAFVFPGQGSQWAGMGRELMRADPAFASAVRACADALRPHVDWDLVDVVSGDAGDAWMKRVDMVQPVLWAVAVGLAEAWRRAGVRPDVVVGHSQGEVTAATVAGILSYEDAALIIAKRSKLVRQSAAPGRMLAVDLDLEGAAAVLHGFEDVVSIAVCNGPRSCVLSGADEPVLLLKEILEADATWCRLVDVDYASHSPQMDELREHILAALAPVRPRNGDVPLMSTVRQEVLDGAEMDVEYWMDNLRRPVMFGPVMERLFDDGVTHVIEVSAHPGLLPSLQQIAATRPEPPAVVPTLRRDRGSAIDFAAAKAQAYVSGLRPFAGLPRTSAPLPAYPWQRRKYWVEVGSRKPTGRAAFEVSLTPSFTEGGAWHGTVDLNLEETPWLRDHRVHDAVVLPGIANLTLAVNAFRARTGSAPRMLANVAFTSDATFAGDDMRLGVQWRDTGVAEGEFVLSSLADGATAWDRHATARVLGDGGAPTPVCFPEHLLSVEPSAAAEFYEKNARRGLPYGPAFQGVRSLRVQGAEALGEIVLPDGPRGTTGPHPALWDSVLQVSLALCDEGETVVPTGIDRIRLLADDLGAPGALWSHAVRRDATRFDLFVFDENRTPVLVLDGLTLRTIASAEGAADGARTYRLVLVEEPAAESEPGGSWVVCAADDDTVLARQLAEAIGEQGGTATVVTAEGTDPRAWAGKFEKAGEIGGIVLVAPDPEWETGLLTLTTITRACQLLAVPPRIAVLTQDAQAVDGGQVNPGAAMFWGFGRVLRREHPEFASMLIDVSATDPAGIAAAATELLGTAGDDQVVLRRGRRLVGRLARGARETDETPSTIHKSGRPPLATPLTSAKSGPSACFELCSPKTAWRSPAQAFRLRPVRQGFWDGLRYRPAARTSPTAGEIEIAVSCVGLNFIDVMKAMGTYPDPVGGDLLGGEAVGRVVAVGTGVDGIGIGDRVVACAFGALGSHVTVRADHSRTVPDGLSDQDAATLPLVMTTAWHSLHDLAGLQSGETVLVHSAAGGLGLAAIQVARLLGAKVIATAGSERKRAYLRELGITKVFDSRDLGWADGVMAASGGRGVDVVLNSLTGPAIARGLGVLAEGGRFIEVGKKDIYEDRSVGLGAFRKGIVVASMDLAGLMERRPARFAELLAEVWSLVAEEALTPLPVIPGTFGAVAESLREMSQGRHIGKFVIAEPDTVPVVEPEPLRHGQLRSDATYVITGGLGALGLSLAEFFASRGARSLALLGRSAPTDQTWERIEALRRQGILADTVAVDVADRAALDAVFARLRSAGRPVRGVVHAAGLLDDATIANLTGPQLRRVLAPKVGGARNLDAVTAEDPLDFFLLFSSAAALVGNPGQAAYAAGNAYMDALAESRRARGLPGTSVQWGPIADIGLAAQDDNRGARLADRGMSGVTVDEAWPALTRVLERDEQVVGYVEMNLRRWFDAYPDTAALPSWGDLVREARQDENVPARAGGGFVGDLRAAPAQERQALIEGKITELAGRVLRIDPAEIDRDTPFKALGLDSLMGLELRNRLESVFGLTLSPTLLWAYGRTSALAGLLTERLFEN
jgi:phthiocerol/phenolphthiocerol synthesis type-I polyketide synthase C